jgi:hypothetical protein
VKAVEMTPIETENPNCLWQYFDCAHTSDEEIISTADARKMPAIGWPEIEGIVTVWLKQIHDI